MRLRAALGAMVMLLLLVASGGCQQMRAMGGFGERLVDVFSGRTPRRAAVRMEDPYFPDERRQGVNELVERDWGQRPPYTERYAQIAQNDRDHLVRAAAIRALNRSRDSSATPLFVKALDDQHELVRLEAAKALSNLPDQNAVAPLVRLVNNANENRDVRIAAADALRHYPSLEVARALIGQLGGREFGIAWQSRQSLRRLTGTDLRYDEGAWLEYVTTGRPFG